MLVFEERGKPEYPEKNLSEQRDLNPGHISGRRALSLLRHPLLPPLLSKLGFLISNVICFMFQIEFFYICSGVCELGN